MIKLKARKVTILTDDDVSLVAGGGDTPGNTGPFSATCGGYTVDFCEQPTHNGFCNTAEACVSDGCPETDDCEFTKNC